MFDIYGSQIRWEGVDVATLNDVNPTLLHEFIVALHAAVEPVEVKCIRCNAEQNVDMICGACQAAAEQDAEDAKPITPEQQAIIKKGMITDGPALVDGPIVTAEHAKLDVKDINT